MDTTGEQSLETGGSLPLHDFSSVVIAAHEIKAPLSVLRQLSLELQTDNLSPAERRRVTQQLQLISERALRFTTDLTRAQRLQTELFETSPVNVLQVLEEVVREMAPLYAAHGRQLVIKPGRVKSPVVANHDFLRRILLNFTDNALHYGDKNGAVYLRASLRRSASMVRLGIRDQGPALPTGLWRAIGKTAARPQSLHARPQSSGLGLAIARQFAEAMDSQVGVIRHRDGATFYVDVPISTQLSLL
jgi:two-component system sensor histidine kinase KdpD